MAAFLSSYFYKYTKNKVKINLKQGTLLQGLTQSRFLKTNVMR